MKVKLIGIDLAKMSSRSARLANREIVALANKPARIAWVALTTEHDYEVDKAFGTP